MAGTLLFIISSRALVTSHQTDVNELKPHPTSIGVCILCMPWDVQLHRSTSSDFLSLFFFFSNVARLYIIRNDVNLPITPVLKKVCSSINLHYICPPHKSCHQTKRCRCNVISLHSVWQQTYVATLCSRMNLLLNQDMDKQTPMVTNQLNSQSIQCSQSAAWFSSQLTHPTQINTTKDSTTSQ